MLTGKRTWDNMRILNYKLLLKKEPEGGYTVTVPSLEGCVTYGETVDDCIKNAREAIELYVETLKEFNEPIPTEDDILEYTLRLEANV